MQTALWNAYNNKIFKNVDYNTQSIIETFNSKIKTSIQCFLFAMKQKEYTLSRWAIHRIDEDKAKEIENLPWKEILQKLLGEISVKRDHKRQRMHNIKGLR